MEILERIRPFKNTLENIENYVKIYEKIVSQIVNNISKSKDKEKDISLNFIFESFDSVISGTNDLWFLTLKKKVQNVNEAMSLLLKQSFIHNKDKLEMAKDILEEFENFLNFIDKLDEPITPNKLLQFQHTDRYEFYPKAYFAFATINIDAFAFKNPLLKYYELINEIANRCCFECNFEDIEDFTHKCMLEKLGNMVEKNGTIIPTKSFVNGYFNENADTRNLYRSSLINACKEKINNQFTGDEEDEEYILEDFFDETRRWDREAWRILEEEYSISYDELYEENHQLWKKIDDKIQNFLDDKGSLSDTEFEDEFFTFCEDIANEITKIANTKNVKMRSK